MGGIILYLMTLALETISVAVRFAVVAGVGALLLGRDAGIALGAIAGLYPVAYSLAALAGLPRGHLLTRLEVGGRRLTATEQGLLDAALARPRALGAPIPRHIFAVERDGLNAFVAGRTLYIYRDLFAHAALPAVVAHELGHYNSLDGRLSGAIFGLTLPGGFLITYLLLGVFQWVTYILLLLLVGLVVMLFLLARVNVMGVLQSIFGVAVASTRYLIIFAVGGVGTAMLRSVWRSYYVEREYAADAYAARMGYAGELIAFFEEEVLSDVAVPWDTQPTHPPTTRRIAALGQSEARPPGPAAHPGPPAAKPPTQPTQPGPQRTPRAPSRLPPTLAPRTLLISSVVAGILAALLLAAALLLGDDPAAAPPPADLAAPTPTLGLPAGQ